MIGNKTISVLFFLLLFYSCFILVVLSEARMSSCERSVEAKDPNPRVVSASLGLNHHRKLDCLMQLQYKSIAFLSFLSFLSSLLERDNENESIVYHTPPSTLQVYSYISFT